MLASLVRIQSADIKMIQRLSCVMSNGQQGETPSIAGRRLMKAPEAGTLTHLIGPHLVSTVIVCERLEGLETPDRWAIP